MTASPFRQPGAVHAETGESIDDILAAKREQEKIRAHKDQYLAQARGKRAAEEELGLARRLVVTRADTITPRRTQWLWAPGAGGQGRIPIGELTLIVGRGGVGKSTLLCTMAAWITIGDMQGEHFETPRDVIYVANEDSLERTVVPRLIAGGADLSRVHFVTMSDAGTEARVMLPTDCAAIEKLAAETGAVAAMLDPLSSNLKVDNSNDQKAVRTVVESIRRMCERANLAAVGLAHTRKAESRNLMDAIMGSSELGNVCRSAMGVMADPDEEGTVVLSQEKSNLGRIDVPSYRYRITDHMIASGQGELISISKLEFLGKTDQRVSEMLVESMANAGGGSSVKECGEWLHSWLSYHGEKPRTEVLAAAAKEKYQEHTLKRAAKKLKIVFRREGWPSVTMWSLPQSRD